jgi:hypothetical protein
MSLSVIETIIHDIEKCVMQKPLWVTIMSRGHQTGLKHFLEVQLLSYEDHTDAYKQHFNALRNYILQSNNVWVDNYSSLEEELQKALIADFPGIEAKLSSFSSYEELPTIVLVYIEFVCLSFYVYKECFTL